MTTYFQVKITSNGFEVDFENPLKIEETEESKKAQIERVNKFISLFNSAIILYEESVKS